MSKKVRTGGSEPQESEPKELPPPTPEELTTAKQAAEQLEKVITTPTLEVALLSQPYFGKLVTRWLQESVNSIIAQLTHTDRVTLYNHLVIAINEQLEKKKQRKGLILDPKLSPQLLEAATGPTLDRQTAVAITIGLKHLIDTLPPPQAKLEVTEKKEEPPGQATPTGVLLPDGENTQTA